MGDKIRKITVHLPDTLVDQALKATGESLTETLRQGLRLVAARSVYDEILNLQGKLNFGIDLKKLRQDRK